MVLQAIIASVWLLFTFVALYRVRRLEHASLFPVRNFVAIRGH